MDHQLTYKIAQQQSAELQRAGADARLASDVPAEQNNPRRSKPITRLSLQLRPFDRRVCMHPPVRRETPPKPQRGSFRVAPSLPHHTLNQRQVQVRHPANDQ